MRKLSIILILLLVLVGCGQSKIEPVSNELLFIVNGKEIKEDDIFDSMRLSPGSVAIILKEAEKLLLQNIVEEDDVFDAKVKSTLQEAKDMMGDNFKLTLSQNGFETEEEYVDAIIKDIARLHIALSNAMNKDYENLKEKRPRKVRVLEVDATDGKKALELLKAKESFEDLDEEYGLESSYYHGEEILVSEITDMDTSILNELLNKEETGILDKVVSASKEGTAYIAEVTNIDADELQDEAIESFVMNTKLSQEYLGKIFTEHKFKIYDQDLYDAFLEEYPEYIK